MNVRAFFIAAAVLFVCRCGEDGTPGVAIEIDAPDGGGIADGTIEVAADAGPDAGSDDATVASDETTGEPGVCTAGEASCTSDGKLKSCNSTGSSYLLLSCDDGDPCTKDECDEVGKACKHVAVPECCATDADCDDGSATTMDRCLDGTLGCRHFPKRCGSCSTESFDDKLAQDWTFGVIHGGGGAKNWDVDTSDAHSAPAALSVKTVGSGQNEFSYSVVWAEAPLTPITAGDQLSFWVWKKANHKGCHQDGLRVRINGEVAFWSCRASLAWMNVTIDLAPYVPFGSIKVSFEALAGSSPAEAGEIRIDDFQIGKCHCCENAASCDDGNPCTFDACSTEFGCVQLPQPSCCGNGVTEPGEECDELNSDDNDLCKTSCKKGLPWNSIDQYLPAQETTSILTQVVLEGWPGYDQAGADMLCRLKTGNAASHAEKYAYVVTVPEAAPGFCMGWQGLPACKNYGPKPQYGVMFDVVVTDDLAKVSEGWPKGVVAKPTCTSK